jgi:hypothetical protein
VLRAQLYRAEALPRQPRGFGRIGITQSLQGLPFLATVLQLVVGRDGVVDTSVRHGRATVQARRFRKGQHRFVVPETL